MRIIIDLEDGEKYGDLMTVTFIGGLGRPFLNCCSNSVGLQQTNRHYAIGSDGKIKEVTDCANHETV